MTGDNTQVVTCAATVPLYIKFSAKPGYRPASLCQELCYLFWCEYSSVEFDPTPKIHLSFKVADMEYIECSGDERNQVVTDLSVFMGTEFEAWGFQSKTNG